MNQSLPPLNAIRAFETAARHLSFARAADELGVTHSAVSKQISILEDYIGGLLFERNKGGVSLTLEGRELKHALTPAFETLSNSFQRYSRRPPRSKKFRLATVASFASQFLVPRLADFEARFPEIQLEILTSDRVLDLSREEVDLSVRYGAGEWEGLVSQKLTSGNLLPVCQPEMLSTNDEDAQKLVASQRRIQVFSTDEWKHWHARTGSAEPVSENPIVMEHFLVALQAVLTGSGIALLPETIVQNHLRDQSLVQFGKLIEWPQAFYMVHLPNADTVRRMQGVMTWMLSTVD